MDALQIAMKCAARMDEVDFTSEDLGISVEVPAPGSAETRFEIRDNMVNGHDICHGGYIFILADSAFAFASNAYDDVTVSAAASIQFLRPASIGDRLCATASERSRSGKSGVYDVVVTNQDGKTVATFRGLSHSTGEPLL